MAHITEPRIGETTTTTGTGPFTTTAALTTHRRLSAVCAVSDTFWGDIEALGDDGAPSGDWVEGLFTYSAANQVTVTEVYRSSNANAAVTFGAGTKRIRLIADARQIEHAYTASGAAFVATGLIGMMDGPNFYQVQARQTPAATPTFSPAAGPYSTTQNVTLSCATAGAAIYYTTDGSTPTTGSTLYTGAISVSNTTTVKAIAAAAHYGNSAVGSALYSFYIVATGGTITTDGNYKVHKFNSSADFVITSGSGDVDYLIVAGGAGGGGGTTAGNSGGGGGAGGVKSGTFTALGTGTYPAVVGAGGAGGASSDGGSGNNSSINSITATGGGGGGLWAGSPRNGVAGGSGGGGSIGTGSTTTGGNGSAGQGNNGGGNGGFTGSPFPAGGGGGAGAVGGTATSNSVAGSGGAGVSSSITGSPVTYGGGGGGCTHVGGGTAGAGGAGGGGAGGAGGAATAGTANTGGGGGGGGNTNLGAAGGSGTVIVRYQFQ